MRRVVSSPHNKNQRGARKLPLELCVTISFRTSSVSAQGTIDIPTTSPESPPLRIGLVAPPWFTVPPQGYGGIERVIAALADALVDQGHDVTLFAPSGSCTRARLVETFPAELHAEIGSSAIEAHNTLLAYAQAAHFDVIHDHTVAGLAASTSHHGPIVHTAHGPIEPRIAGLYEALPRNVHLVAISHHQRSTFPSGVEPAVIWNTLDTSDTPFSAEPGDYLLFVGRAAPEKGLADALTIAERAGLPLRVLLKVNEDREFAFLETLRPRLSRPGVQLEFDATESVKRHAFAGALATLFPISWDEPFGMVMIESMAAGTPVIAYPRGAAPEVIEDGVTGYLCTDAAESEAAIEALDRIDRLRCRERVERLFNPADAAKAHAHLYQRALQAARA